MNFVKLLQLLVSLGPKVTKAMELLKALYDLFAIEIATAFPSGGNELQQVAVNPEEEALMGQISEAMTAQGTQAAMDFSRIRNLFRFLNDAGLVDILFKVFTKAVV